MIVENNLLNQHWILPHSPRHQTVAVNNPCHQINLWNTLILRLALGMTKKDSLKKV